MKWEYKTIKLPLSGFLNKTVDLAQLENAMNPLGDDGWELVSSIGSNMGFGETSEVVAIFKRAQGQRLG